MPRVFRTTSEDELFISIDFQKSACDVAANEQLETKDIYRWAASQIFGIPEEDVT
jgi:hypothetical protein